MNLSLYGKHALVGGASAGIGRAVAGALAHLGASVTLLARTEQTLREAVAQLPADRGQQHHYVVADFANPDDLLRQVQQHLLLRPAHILVNNTGGPPGGPIVGAAPEAFLAAYHNHLICNQLLAQAVLPGMQAEGYGRIINIISTSVKEPLEGLGVSNTTRWAVAAWAKTWANEVARHGITVNNVLPGFTQTGRLTEIIDKRAAASGKTPEEVAQQFRAAVPAQRFGQPEEVAAAVAFLASPAAAYINGINLPVDGGRTKSL
ncbi:MAG TPA: SDR family oxidoreductase [Saprospiraceae bacterium]|nr:SDR family oxidoreductase [Saprospiraceae bacterium]HND87729.1 SDR family oxidoreductase [Saprospiraceae bacterium]